MEVCKSRKQKNRHYDDDLKMTAIRLVTEGDRRAGEVEKELGYVPFKCGNRAN